MFNCWKVEPHFPNISFVLRETRVSNYKRTLTVREKALFEPGQPGFCI